MPAVSNWLESRAAGRAGLQGNRSERRDCSLNISLETPHGNAGVTIRNISPGGIGFTTDTVLVLRPGDQLLASHPLIGRVTCVVRWAIHPRYGAEFTSGPQALGPALAFYDTLPPPPGEAP